LLLRKKVLLAYLKIVVYIFYVSFKEGGCSNENDKN